LGKIIFLQKIYTEVKRKQIFLHFFTASCCYYQLLQKACCPFHILVICHCNYVLLNIIQYWQLLCSNFMHLSYLYRYCCLQTRQLPFWTILLY